MSEIVNSTFKLSARNLSKSQLKFRLDKESFINLKINSTGLLFVSLKKVHISDNMYFKYFQEFNLIKNINDYIFLNPGDYIMSIHYVGTPGPLNYFPKPTATVNVKMTTMPFTN